MATASMPFAATSGRILTVCKHLIETFGLIRMHPSVPASDIGRRADLCRLILNDPRFSADVHGSKLSLEWGFAHLRGRYSMTGIHNPNLFHPHANLDETVNSH